MKFGEKVHELIAARDISVSELCARSGISKQNMSKILSSKTSAPRIDTAVKVAGALGVGLDELLSGVDGCDKFVPKPFFYERVSSIAKCRGISQADFMRLTGMSSAQAHFLFCKTKDPRLSSIVAVSNAFDMPVSELVDGVFCPRVDDMD